jgi:hypothetical protein
MPNAPFRMGRSTVSGAVPAFSKWQNGAWKLHDTNQQKHFSGLQATPIEDVVRQMSGISRQGMGRFEQNIDPEGGQGQGELPAEVLEMLRARQAQAGVE